MLRRRDKTPNHLSVSGGGGGEEVNIANDLFRNRRWEAQSFILPVLYAYTKEFFNPSSPSFAYCFCSLCYYRRFPTYSFGTVA
jgi:hypothetical protein